VVDPDTKEVLEDHDRAHIGGEDYDTMDFEFELLTEKVQERFDVENGWYLVVEKVPQTGNEQEHVCFPIEGVNPTDSWQSVVRVWKKQVRNNTEFLFKMQWEKPNEDGETDVEYDVHTESEEEQSSDEEVSDGQGGGSQ
jgi:hypothetical protein